MTRLSISIVPAHIDTHIQALGRTVELRINFGPDAVLTEVLNPEQADELGHMLLVAAAQARSVKP